MSKTVEQYLSAVDYKVDSSYIPSEFALEFVNFIKLVNGEDTENKTPVVHYHMLDTFYNSTDIDVINLCHRGIAKSTLKEYLILYLAVYGEFPNFGKVPYGLYVSDSMDNGVGKMRKALEYRYHNSTFLQKYIPKIKFTENRWEFFSVTGYSVVFSGHGAKALNLASKLYTEYGVTTIGNCKVGDKIYGADGQLCNITHKSEIFNKPMYRLSLSDGRSIKVSEDHINSVLVRSKHSHEKVRVDLTTKELLQIPLVYVRDRKTRITKENLVFVENCQPVQFPEADLPIDPYTLGVILGGGRVRKRCGSVELTGHIDDFPHYLDTIPYTFGAYQIDRRNTNVRTQSIRGLGKALKLMKLNVHGNFKFIPTEYLRGSVEQRLSLLQGLMDTDGTISARKIRPVMSFCSNSKELVNGVQELVYSLGGHCHLGKTGEAYRLQVHLNVPVFKLPRKLSKQQYTKKGCVAVTCIEQIPTEPSQCIAVDNVERQFITEMYFRTHNTGVRGTRENGSRPVMALLDDLISDADARSPTVIAAVEETVYKAIDYALHPTRRKIIWSGTPFNAKDPIYKGVESGAWEVNIFPVCEHFPCKQEDFRGSWEDRFPYSYVLKQYNKAFKAKKLDTFNQELMLKIMSEEERLIKDSDIQWYKRNTITQNKAAFNWYITTDFATSAKTSGDFSVISVWAYNSNGDWFWVDGICARQTMDKNVNDLFRLVQLYRPISVGIEVSGQQGGFIPWIKNEMGTRNNYFNLASDSNSGSAGIRPTTDKLTRFNVVVPWFKQHKIYLPEELKSESILQEAINELSLVTYGAMKSKHDDWLDTVSMLALMSPWRPSVDIGMSKAVGKTDLWEFEEDEDTSAYNSYIV